ncbi:hypothetical protein ACFLRO_01695 [Bacteroidota bacterium]
MTHQPLFRFEQRDQTGGVVFDGANPIAEIRELRLCNVVFRPQGRLIIGEDVRLPLYWEQYANHQDPERNAGSHGRLKYVSGSASRISLRIESASHSREVTSRYLLDVSHSEQDGSYVFDFRCRLDVSEGKQWHVSHNPSHGELEFCNLWPEGAFMPGKEEAKRYAACFVRRENHTERISHHHLETSDKHNIGMDPGDRFMWLLEDENPVVEICSSEPVAAGLCAYMWDAHFAYRICKDGTEAELPSGSTYDAHFRLFSITREAGEKVVSVATARESPELETIPLYVAGLNSFSETLSGNEAAPDLWPWEHEPEIPDVIEYALDRNEGHSDDASVRIRALRPTTGRWLATTLGPAFGEAPFASGKRYRLSGFVKSRDLIGAARIGLRLHRTGMGDVFDFATYETYYSDNDDSATGTTDWRAIEVTTPVIDPPPDRMHLLLEMDGAGTCWFDDIVFERNL